MANPQDKTSHAFSKVPEVTAFFWIVKALFAAIIAIPTLGHLRFGMGAILAFWFAYVDTRPLGASVADWLAKSESGLGLGTGPVSLAFAAVIFAFVCYLARSGRDTPSEQAFAEPPAPRAAPARRSVIY